MTFNLCLLPTNRGWEINQVSTFCCSNAGKISRKVGTFQTYTDILVSVFHHPAAWLHLLIPQHEHHQRGLSLWSRGLHSLFLFKTLQRSDQKLTFSLIKNQSVTMILASKPAMCSSQMSESMIINSNRLHSKPPFVLTSTGLHLRGKSFSHEDSSFRFQKGATDQLPV